MDTLPVNLPRQVGLYIRRARTAQGLTRAQLAALSGVSERSLASIELGDATGVRLDKLLTIYSALGLSLLTQGDNITRESESSSNSAHGSARRSTSPRRTTAQDVPRRSRRKIQASAEPSNVDYNAAFSTFIARNYSFDPTNPTPKFTGRR